MVRWMCGIKVKDTVPSRVEKERLGFDDITLLLQQNRLRRYRRVLRKEDNNWVEKCMEYVRSGARSRPKRNWREFVQKDCQGHNLSREDAMEHSRWRKLIKDS